MSDDYSFPSERRLSQSSLVQSVLDRGEMIKGKYCHLFLGERDDERTRATFIVSEKSAGKATLRNRIKRLMRESFRLQLPYLEEGWPLVFLATRAVDDTLKRQDFDHDIQGLLQSADLYQETSERVDTP